MESDHDRIESILVTALEIESETERQEYVQQACGEDSGLRNKVSELIKNHLQAGSFLDVHNPSAADPDSILGNPGSMIGPYKLLEKIGEGGMGIVFLAEQTEPVRRQVAVKVTRAGLDSALVVARFELERQALAVMDHPNIARVIDGGVIADGRPWFAMELIQGVPITDYCDQHHLKPRQRLELFVPVCLAIQHAHQKGIIHRDLKPSNVLVIEADGRPTPKVIDFGVAKAVGTRLSSGSLNTQFGTIIGTLEYMSPEQTVPNHQDIDTRSDIYCLGVLLYELLTGTTPHQRKNLRDDALLEMLRIIREDDPPKPSNRLSTIDELPSVAACRGVEPRTLSHVVRGDLDWIVMKCLEKDRNRRYSTANGVARDIERFLCNEPVEAGPPGAAYRVRKFLWRNRWPAAAVTLLLLSLVGGIIGTSIGMIQSAKGQAAANQALEIAQSQRGRAERHYQRAMSVVDRLLTRVGRVRLESVPHMDETRRQILEDALEVYQEILQDEGDDPAIRREVGMAWQRIGDIQIQLSRQPQAEESLNHAIGIQQQLVTLFPNQPEYETDFLRSHRQLAYVLFRSGRFPEAEKIVDNMLSRDSTETLIALSERSMLQYLRGLICAATQRMDEAISACKASLEFTDGSDRGDASNSSQDQLDRANVLSFLGNLYRMGRRPDEAEKCQQEARIMLEQLLTDEPENIDIQNRLAALFINMGLTFANLNRQSEAEAIYGKAIATLDALARDHPKLPNYKFDLAKAHNNVALWHSKINDPAAAATENGKALVIFEELMQNYPERLEFASSYAGGCSNQGKYFLEQERWEDSLAWNTKAIEAAEDLLKREPRHSETRRLLHNSLIGRAGTHRKLKQIELAIRDYRRSLELSEGEQHVIYVNFRPRALSFVGHHRQAVTAADAIVTDAGVTSSNFNEMAKVYATCIEAVGQDATLSDSERTELAEHYARRSVELLSKAAEKDHFQTLDDVESLRSDDRLQPIQNRDDFKKFLAELGQSIQSRK